MRLCVSQSVTRWAAGPVPAPRSPTASRCQRRTKGPRGYDAGKRVRGRKRHLVLNTLGLLLVVAVHATNLQDRDGTRLRHRFPRLQHLWADAGYSGPKLETWMRETTD